ncbi:DUF805 domain-containing protein [Sphingomonas sp.]|uniref:DUF805 domain-containing protein n=1 Tax=Sphingomonas sp. TaxID=28214 RepID=UPI001DA6261F|nr:DUF805 domain-containing protein [Sphingomonas sp.]MBX9796055.1 DUF805 domain-containing protein [Sphingomonas sp.]
MEWMILPLKRYADFQGRSRRMEYWMFTLLTAIVFGVLIFGFGLSSIILTPETLLLTPTAILGLGLSGLFALALAIPSIAVQVRRFHDQDLSGWFVLLNLIPYLGGLVVLVFMLLPGKKGPNRFGPDPKEHGVASFG